MDVLAGLDQLARLYDRPGPFLSVYLDASRNTESGAREVDARWRDVRDDLARRGADGQALEAVGASVEQDRGAPGPHGLVVVADTEGVHLHEHLHHPPARSSGALTPLPHLLPYLAQRTTDLPHVVVVADRSGADVFSVGANGTGYQTSVSGPAQHPLHRTGRDDWSERHFQQRVENSWHANARDVAATVDRLVRTGAARLVVVAGDPRARALIVDDLRDVTAPRVTVQQVAEGGRAAGSSSDALQHAVRTRVLHQAWRERRQVLDHLAQNLGRREYAAAGVAAVTEALRRHDADTVVLSDDPSSTLRAWIGPGSTDFGIDEAEAVAFGVTTVQHDRYDAALVRAALGTGAKLVVTPGAHDYLPDGIGALLRSRAGLPEGAT